LAHRVAGLLRRVGLNPLVYRHPSKDELIVLTSSKALLEFLPRKELLGGDVEARERFFEENGLFTVGFGIPFVAGLIDGDGSCDVGVTRGRSCFGSVNQWHWSFSQCKYLFLVDYVMRFVGSIVWGGVRREVRADGCVTVHFRKVGVEALLGAGIFSYLWKAEQWLRKVAEARSERSHYTTTGQVARALNVSDKAVVKWLKAGKMSYHRRAFVSVKKKRGEKHECESLSWFYIPASEWEEFIGKLSAEREKVERVKGEGVTKLTDVARTLGISLNTLHTWRRRGRLQATLLRELGVGKCYVVPREEVEKLKKQASER